MNEMETAISQMYGGALSPDTIITIAKHSQWVEIDGERQVIISAEGLLELAKDLPADKAERAREMVAAVREHYRKES